MPAPLDIVTMPAAAFRRKGPIGRYLKKTFGPALLAQSVSLAAVDHFSRRPSAWSQGPDGYGRRFARVFGRFAAEGAITMAMGAALGQASDSARCECSGGLRRLGHALTSTVMARTSSGGRTVDAARVAGVYGGAMVATTWQPGATAMGGLRSGSLSLGAVAAINVAREFWPDLKRAFR
jgi:hypothetical protein